MVVRPGTEARAVDAVGLFTAADALKVAEQLMAADDPTASAAGNVEPDSPLAAKIAVEHLNELLHGLPAFVRRALAGAERNADRLSDDRFQGLAELIQNADDVGASTVTFTVETVAAVGSVVTRLVAIHDGAPLRLRDVVAMGVPWLSMKSEDPTKVGEFGIGLMTLRALSDILDVHCGHFHLRFSPGRVSYLTDAHNYPNGVQAQTVFRVPVEPDVLDVEDIEQWLARWGDAGLLFLSNVKSVVLTDAAEGVYARSASESATRGADGQRARPRLRLGIAREAAVPLSESETSVNLANGPVRDPSNENPESVSAIRRRLVAENSGARWAVYTRSIETPRVARRSGKARHDTTVVALAFPLPGSTDGPAATREEGRPPGGMIHVGLPVRPIALPFRISAPFEPLANRRDLADSAWNHALISEVSELWWRASVDSFQRSAADAWRTVPLAAELAGDRPLAGRLRDVLADQLLTAARTRWAESVSFPTEPAGRVRFDRIAVEHSDLTGILGPDEITELTNGLAMLPEQCRDDLGRWRAVLDEMDEIDAPGPRRVDVADAVRLLATQGRAPELMAALTGAALAHGLASQLDDLWCVATASGARQPASLESLPVLTDATAHPIWHTLAIGMQVDETYAGSPAWDSVSAWLAESGRFAAGATVAQAMRRLSSAGENGHVMEEALTDEQAQALRAAIESLDDDGRLRVGPGIGKAVRFAAITYDTRGQRNQVSARPCEAYINDREPDSWFVAAARTPHLVWLHPRYTNLLRSPAGRAGGVGAQRLFRMLGAESAPRVSANPREERKYQGQPRAVPFAAVTPAARTLMQSLDADHLIEDTVSPDLDRVLASIASERSAAERRRRASAVLASLSRAWDRLPTQAHAVKGYYGWNRQGQIPATWILKTREVTWLSNGRGAKRAAPEMAVRTPGTVAMLGSDPAAFLHPEHDRPGWRDVLLALGVRGDPKASDLVDELRHLRTKTQTDADVSRAEAVEAASAIYEALATLVDPGPSPAVGDVPHRALLSAFASGPGLIATEHGWRRPNQVLEGPAVFGNLRAFVPAVTGGTRLWRALNIRPPRAEDAEQVIRELAKTRRLASEYRLVAIEALRILAAAQRGTKSGARGLQLPARTTPALDLRKLPVWTGHAWERNRPVFAVSDPRLADALARHVAVWRPGADLHQFEVLIRPLRLTPVAATDMTVVVDDTEYDDDATATFQAAVTILQADLALNDPTVEQALTITWDELAAYEVAVSPDLRVRSALQSLSRVPPVPAHAWASATDRALYVSKADYAGAAEHGGLAIAALFGPTNPRRVALPWLDAWTKAAAGIREQALVIAARKQAEEAAQRTRDSQRRLEELQRSTAQRNRKASKGGSAQGGPGRNAAPAPASPPSAPPQPSRTLIEPARFVLAEQSGSLLPGTAPKRDAESRKNTARPVPPRPPTGKSAPSRRGPVSYTPREREDVGMLLARIVLGGEDSGIVDIRDQRRVGADAVDALEKFYELKVHAGPIPDQIRLTDSEVQKALSTPDYFLVLVGNVEEGNGAPEVRIVNDPLGHLTPTDSGSITLSGVNSAQALQFTFSPSPEVNTDQTRDADSNLEG